MSASTLIACLKKVRQTGRGNWVACCPAHDDRSPSMTIKETDDGTVLAHCFAGCSVDEILGAVGLDFDALFPEKPQEYRQPMRRPFNAHDVLAAVANEALVVAIYASDVRHGRPLYAEDRERLMVAYERLTEAVRLSGG